MSRIIIVLAAVCAITYGAHPGTSLADDGYRIVSGEPADITDIPYQLYIESAINITHIKKCGGSIISKNWALTAAHCIDGIKASKISVFAGISNLSEVDSHHGSRHQVTKVKQHPKFKSTRTFSTNDYALLKVEPPFPLDGERVAAIKMSDSEPKGGEIAVTSGWGRFGTNEDGPDQPFKVEVPIVDRFTCEKAYNAELHTSWICAGQIGSNKGVCFGDSGGPLAVDGVLVGIVSGTHKCGDPEHPDIYANVADQRDWIRENCGI